MLEMMRQAEGIAETVTIPEVQNPETLLAAAQAADRLEAQLPEIATAASTTLASVQAVLAEIATSI